MESLGVGGARKYCYIDGRRKTRLVKRSSQFKTWGNRNSSSRQGRKISRDNHSPFTLKKTLYFYENLFIKKQSNSRKMRRQTSRRRYQTSDCPTRRSTHSFCHRRVSI